MWNKPFCWEYAYQAWSCSWNQIILSIDSIYTHYFTKCLWIYFGMKVLHVFACVCPMNLCYFVYMYEQLLYCSHVWMVPAKIICELTGSPSLNFLNLISCSRKQKEPLVGIRTHAWKTSDIRLWRANYMTIVFGIFIRIDNVVIHIFCSKFNRIHCNPTPYDNYTTNLYN